MKQHEWTTSYHGVSHLNGTRAQHTINIWDGFTVAKIFPEPGAPNFFSNVRKRTFLATEHPDHVAAAKEWCEANAEREHN